MIIVLGINGLVFTFAFLLFAVVHCKSMYYGLVHHSEEGEKLIQTSSSKYTIYFSAVLSILLSLFAVTMLWLGFSLPWLEGGSLIFIILSILCSVGLYGELTPRMLTLFK